MPRRGLGNVQGTHTETPRKIRVDPNQRVVNDHMNSFEIMFKYPSNI